MSSGIVRPQSFVFLLRPFVSFVVTIFIAWQGLALRAQPATIAISGATLIDGTGSPPLADAVVLISGGRITAAGPRATVRVPPDASIIEGKGKYVVPGLVDTNVHLSLYGGMADRYETLARYHPRQREIVLEAAQLQLKYGITTVRDSYGPGSGAANPGGGKHRWMGWSLFGELQPDA
jgi:imidazolonepropionase-like amidohydrolase